MMIPSRSLRTSSLVRGSLGEIPKAGMSGVTSNQTRGYDWRETPPRGPVSLMMMCRKRVLPHDTLQDHLRARYFLPPSVVYSVIRLSRDGATYDIPLDAEWVTIAVVAERGDIKVSGKKDDDDGSDDEVAPEADAKQKPAKGKRPYHRQRPRKYINLRLASLPPRNPTLGSGGTLGGDALLQLLLFEADAVERNGDDRTYRGGSGGAYERWANLAVGSVVGIVTPRVLRPLKVGWRACAVLWC